MLKHCHLAVRSNAIELVNLCQILSFTISPLGGAFCKVIVVGRVVDFRCVCITHWGFSGNIPFRTNDDVHAQSQVRKQLKATILDQVKVILICRAHFKNHNYAWTKTLKSFVIKGMGEEIHRRHSIK